MTEQVLDPRRNPVLLVRVGFRRLYDAIGCSLAAAPEARFTLELGSGFQAEAYIGPRPRFGISVYRSDKYMVPGQESAEMLRCEFQPDASRSSYPRKFFTEVFCSKESRSSRKHGAGSSPRRPVAKESR